MKQSMLFLFKWKSNASKCFYVFLVKGKTVKWEVSLSISLYTAFMSDDSDSSLYLKLKGYMSLAVWKLQWTTLSQIFCWYQRACLVRPFPVFPVGTTPLHEVFKCFLDSRVKSKGLFYTLSYGTIPSLSPWVFLGFFWLVFSGCLQTHRTKKNVSLNMWYRALAALWVLEFFSV